MPLTVEEFELALLYTTARQACIKLRIPLHTKWRLEEKFRV